MTQKFNINTLIQKGKELVFEYELPAGTVYYRPLTDLEMDEAEANMISIITDPVTRAYITGLSETDDDNDNEVEDNIDNIDNVDFAQIARGNAVVVYNIVLTAIQDFSDEEITIDDISKLSGMRDLADEIKRASGYDTDVIAEVEEFREDE